MLWGLDFRVNRVKGELGAGASTMPQKIRVAGRMRKLVALQMQFRAGMPEFKVAFKVSRAKNEMRIQTSGGPSGPPEAE